MDESRIANKLIATARTLVSASSGRVVFTQRGFELRFVPPTYDYQQWNQECHGRYLRLIEAIEAGYKKAVPTGTISITSIVLPATVVAGGGGQIVLIAYGYVTHNQDNRYGGFVWGLDPEIADSILKEIKKAGFIIR